MRRYPKRLKFLSFPLCKFSKLKYSDKPRESLNFAENKLMTTIPSFRSKVTFFDNLDRNLLAQSDMYPVKLDFLKRANNKENTHRRIAAVLNNSF